MISDSPMGARPATSDDLDAIHDLETRVHGSPWSKEGIRTEFEKPYSHFLLLTDDETDSVLYGYICYWEMGEEFHVLNVAVDPQFQRKGLGRKLVGLVVDHALRSHVDRIFLEVRKSNVPAIQLYQSGKFHIKGVRRGFYSDGEDAYMMEWNPVDGIPDF